MTYRSMTQAARNCSQQACKTTKGKTKAMAFPPTVILYYTAY